MRPMVQLNNNVQMPQEGIGVFQLTDFDECKNVILSALGKGYRLIDTAQIYQNERAVGAAIKESSVPRDELFITTKVWLPFYGEQSTIKEVNASLERLGLDYLDLVLLHEPYGDYYGAYRALEKLLKAQKVRAIGVSNFDESQLLDLMHHMEVPPAVNQVELNLYQQQAPLRQFQQKHGIALEAWSPLGQAQEPILQEPLLRQLATKYQRTTAQISLRFLTQLGAIVIPKAANDQHQVENLNLWDFQLIPYECGQLAKLNKKQWLSPNRHLLSTTQHYMNLIDRSKNF